MKIRIFESIVAQIFELVNSQNQKTCRDILVGRRKNGTFSIYDGNVRFFYSAGRNHFGKIVSGSDDQKTAKGYFLAGNGLGGTFIAGSMLLTNLSAENLVGLSGQSYAANMSVWHGRQLQSLQP